MLEQKTYSSIYRNMVFILYITQKSKSYIERDGVTKCEIPYVPFLFFQSPYDANFNNQTKTS